MTYLYQKWPKGWKTDDLKQESKPIIFFNHSEYILWSQSAQVTNDLLK